MPVPALIILQANVNDVLMTLVVACAVVSADPLGRKVLKELQSRELFGRKTMGAWWLFFLLWLEVFASSCSRVVTQPFHCATSTTQPFRVCFLLETSWLGWLGIVWLYCTQTRTHTTHNPTAIECVIFPFTALSARDFCCCFLVVVVVVVVSLWAKGVI